MSRLVLLGAVLLLAASAAVAQGPPATGQPGGAAAESEKLPLPQPSAAPTLPEGRGAAYYLLRALGSLVLVAGIVVGCYYLGLRLRATGPAARSGPIEVLHTKPLGPGRALHVIQVEGHRLLVGSSPNGVRLIRELDDQPPEDNASDA